MERSKKAENGTRGAVMLESLIVYPVTIFLLFFILAIFCVLFQRWNIQTIANEAVARMAQTYRLDEGNESTGYVTEDQLNDVAIYRYVSNKRSATMKLDVTEKIADYAGWRLTATTFAKSIEEPNASVEVREDSLGRRHLELTLKGEYAIPFGEALAFFGYDSTIKYETKAYAECVDIIDYINFVDYVKQQTSQSRFDSKVLGLIDAAFGLFDNIFNH